MCLLLTSINERTSENNYSLYQTTTTKKSQIINEAYWLQIHVRVIYLSSVRLIGIGHRSEPLEISTLVVLHTMKMCYLFKMDESDKTIAVVVFALLFGIGFFILMWLYTDHYRKHHPVPKSYQVFESYNRIHVWEWHAVNAFLIWTFHDFKYVQR